MDTEKSFKELADHFFRKEYGKIVSVITGYLGTDHVETAEDIVQEALLNAYHSWQHKGIPENPQAWLYTAAKNLTLNSLKRGKYAETYKKSIRGKEAKSIELEFTDQLIKDEQLRMMFVCCDSSIAENSQITLILKILCGFSITEIANVFFTSKETINKRLVRGRKQLRDNPISFEHLENIKDTLPIVLKTIYLLFTEGYSPSQKDELIRYDLCLEAIRLGELLISNDLITDKADSYSLLALMYFNASRFDARMNDDNMIVELEQQDRSKWNKSFVNKGSQYLQYAMEGNRTSIYLILATISANHCVAASFNKTNWVQILSLYDDLIAIEDSPIARLNRAVALAKVKGNDLAVDELIDLETQSDIGSYYLFHTTLGYLYKEGNEDKKAILSYQKAISLTTNERDKKLIQKKLMDVVPIL